MTRVYVEAYGCSANQADSEIASGLLVEAGHTLVRRSEDAEVTVILTCIVKTPTERKMIRRLNELSGKKIVVAGCMPKAMRGVVEEAVPGASLVGPDDVVRITEAVDITATGGRIVCLDGSSQDRTCYPRERKSGVIHIAPIATGCLGNCSYCIVKLARGKLFSFSARGIVKDAKAAIESGCKEVWVTAEDTAAYDADGIQLPGLIDQLSKIDGEFKIRVGMMTPNTALPIIDDLIETYRGKKVFKFLHVPVQSGSDETLSKMRRKYRIKDFKELVNRFRSSIPDLSIATDVICGFPGESEEQFVESLSLVEWLRPSMLNISRFWPRPGTEAAVLEGQFPSRITKDRSRRIDELWERVVRDVNNNWIGWEGNLLLDEVGHSGAKIGRNDSYKAVAVKTNVEPGESIRVRITGAARGYLLGEEI